MGARGEKVRVKWREKEPVVNKGREKRGRYLGGGGVEECWDEMKSPLPAHCARSCNKTIKGQQQDFRVCVHFVVCVCVCARLARKRF